MKLVNGSTDNLPATVHVEQDGNWFFVLPGKPDYSRDDWYQPALAVLDTEMHVGFDLESGKASQDVIRAFLTSKNITATFDY